MGELTLVQLNVADRTKALKKLGYAVNNEGFVIHETSGKEVICKYSNEKVHISTAAILPGSLLIINATPITMSQYFLEYDY